MTILEIEQIRGKTLDLALSWRHMLSPIEDIRKLGKERVNILSEELWSLCLEIGDNSIIDVSKCDSPNFSKTMVGAYLAKALIHAEKGRFLSFCTTFKNDLEIRDIFGIKINDRIYSLDYLSSLMNSGNSINDIDISNSLDIFNNVRPVRGRNPNVMYEFKNVPRIGREYTIVAKRNPNTTNDKPEDRQDPLVRLDQDDASGTITCFCPDRRKAERSSRVEIAKKFSDLGQILEWAGEKPSQQEIKDSQYIEKPGDGCRRINVSDINRVNLSNYSLLWNI